MASRLSKTYGTAPFPYFYCHFSIQRTFRCVCCKIYFKTVRNMCLAVSTFIKNIAIASYTPDNSKLVEGDVKFKMCQYYLSAQIPSRTYTDKKLVLCWKVRRSSNTFSSTCSSHASKRLIKTHCAVAINLNLNHLWKTTLWNTSSNLSSFVLFKPRFFLIASLFFISGK